MFRKYNTIENTYRKEFLERIKNQGFGDEEYVVQEKVHGANLSFITRDGKNFYVAKRTGLIEDGEKFYNYEKVFEDVKPQLEKLWKELKKDYPEMQQLNVFGELFGGHYPHPEVPKDKNGLMIQKGIFYSPDNRFYAFDILINNEKFLDVDTASKYFDKAGLLHAKSLFRGSLDECLQYPNDFESTIPAELGLPEIESNIAEGTVIKPVKPLFFNNGVRVILKNKNEKWAEKIKRKKINKEELKPSEKVLELQEAIKTYVTENRLNNVISKIGEVSQKDFGKLLGLYNKDIVEDFSKDYADMLKDLDKKEIKLINKSIYDITRKMIKEKIL